MGIVEELKSRITEIKSRKSELEKYRAESERLDSELGRIKSLLSFYEGGETEKKLSTQSTQPQQGGRASLAPGIAQAAFPLLLREGPLKLAEIHRRVQEEVGRCTPGGVSVALRRHRRFFERVARGTWKAIETAKENERPSLSHN